MDLRRLNQLRERGGAALRKYERLMAANQWDAVAEFQHAYQENPEAVEAAAAAEEAATKGGK